MADTSKPVRRYSHVDDLVKNVSLHVPLPALVHGYVLPFVFLYAAWFYGWVFVYGVEDYLEAGWIVLAAIAVVQILVSLSCYWSVHVRTFLTCSKESDPLVALYAKVVPTPNNGSPKLIRLTKERVIPPYQFPTYNTATSKTIMVSLQDPHGRVSRIWFVFQKTRYYWEPGFDGFRSISFPIDKTYGHYMEWKGYQDEEVKDVEKFFGRNE